MSGSTELRKKAKKIYLGVNEIVKKVKKIYVGDSNNIARLAYSGGVKNVSTRVGGAPALSNPYSNYDCDYGRYNMVAGSTGTYALFTGGRIAYYYDSASTWYYTNIAVLDYYDKNLTKGSNNNGLNSSYGSASANTGEYLIMFGGCLDSSTNAGHASTLGRGRAYNASLTTKFIDMDVSRYWDQHSTNSGACTVNNNAIILGGMKLYYDGTDDRTVSHNSVCSYNSSLTRSTLSSLSSAGKFFTRESGNRNYCMVFGTSVSNNVDVYNSNLVKSITSGPSIRSGNSQIFSLASCGDYIIVRGSAIKNGDKYESHVAVYDSSFTYRILDSNIPGTYAPSSSSHPHIAAFTGGSIPGDGDKTSGYFYNTELTATYFTAQAFAGTLASVTDVGKYILIGGGKKYGGNYSGMFNLSMVTLTITD